MSRKTRLVLLAGALLGAAAILLAVAPATVFELDGNSTQDGTVCTAPNTPAGCTDDWNTLNGTTGFNGVAGGSLDRTFVSGPASPNVFTGGGSKDPNDIPSWKYKVGGAPDKNTLTNGYAAAYREPGGNLIFVFGAERFAVNGDSNIGLWFFQDNVGPAAGGSGFTGAHTLHDLFVVSAFTQGGAQPNIAVYEWNPGCSKGVKNPVPGPMPGSCADTNLRLLFNEAQACGGVGACALVNSAPVTVSWPYSSKFGGPANQVPTGGFYEGGIDVTFLLQQAGVAQVPCFSSFLIETRSSQSTDAVLKDFLHGKFEICGLETTKTCPADGVVKGGVVEYTFNGTVKNTGFGALYNATVVDNLPTGATNVVFTPAGGLLGTINGGETKNWSVKFDLAALSAPNSAFAKASLTSGGTPGACTGDPNTLCSPSSTVATCSATVANSITVSKHCGVPIGHPIPGGGGNVSGTALPGTQLVTQSGLAAVRVNFSGQVCNTGQTTLSGHTLTDVPAATTTLASTGPLAPGACVNYSGTYLPSGATNLGLVPGRYGFSDNIFVSGATAALGSSPPVKSACTNLPSAPATAQNCESVTCNLCPASPSGLCGGN